MSSSSANGPVVLDASAVLALLFEEPGAAVVRASLRNGVIGAVNLAEVLAKLSDHGLPAMEAIRAVDILGLDVMPMTKAVAQRSSELRSLTRAAGLSLGDRACMALALELGAPAVTADRSWKTVDWPAGVDVQLVR